jgi:disease resistance protein RPS2
MENLRVLDLHATRIASLPSSISSLTRLLALYLNSCNCLRELPCSIKKLTCLEILDIQGIGINYLPIQIGSLENLKCLRLSLSNVGMGQSSDVEFGKGVLSKLVKLEELRISGDKDIQELENVVKAITQKVASLTHLTSLSMCFPIVDCLEAFISIFPLWKDNHFTFQFSVGHHDSTRYQILDYFECHQIKRCMKFVNGQGEPTTISKVLVETDAFELVGHKRTSKLSDFGVDNINKMRGCLTGGCKEIETLVDGNSITKIALIMLEEMHIIDAASLTNIWEGVVHAGSLALLKTLTLYKCSKLKTIFSSDMIGQLSKLQNLRVEKCPKIQEIIMKSENCRLESLVLPKLKVLELLDIEQVKSIWIDDSIKWPSLVKVKVYKCPSLSKFPFTKENVINWMVLDIY